MSDYPTRDQLDKIKNWDYKDFIGCMEFIKEIWHWSSWGFFKRENIYWLHTGGWSGNEDIVGAMEENEMLWQLHWVSSERGGHYKFEARVFID